LQQVYVASPVRPLTYILGMALSELAFALPAMVLFLGILLVVHPFGAVAFAALVGVVLLTWLMACTLGFFVSTLFQQLREIWPLGTLIFSTLSVLPPIFYPATVIPKQWQWVAYLAPSTYAGQLADGVVGLGGGITTSVAFLNTPLFDLLGLGAITLLLAAAATYFAHWRER
ncbi:MAG: ABC transporter permease, partial [Thermoplasmata archaeon]|nr:ABC transporter permease [Thermoplasmata archaeon]